MISGALGRLDAYATSSVGNTPERATRDASRLLLRPGRHQGVIRTTTGTFEQEDRASRNIVADSFDAGIRYRRHGASGHGRGAIDRGYAGVVAADSGAPRRARQPDACLARLHPHAPGRDNSTF